MVVLNFFGTPTVERNGRHLRFDTRKAVAMLAYLATRGRPATRDALCELLWPHLDQRRARASLRRTLSVTAAQVPELSPGREEVQLDLDAVTCDVLRFGELVDSDVPADWVEAANLGAQVFLDGFALRDSPTFDDWQSATAEGLRADRAFVLGLLVTSEEREGRLPQALAWAHARVAADRLSEPAHVDLIRLLAAAGDRTAALVAHRDLIAVLDQELGVTPLPTTLALREQVRAGAIRPTPVAETATEIRPGAFSQEADAVSALVAGVQARLEKLGDVARQLVEAIAVLGSPADQELVRTMAGRTESEVQGAVGEAFATGLLVAPGDRLAVAHPLVVLVTEDGLTVARRRRLHSRAADLLARSHDPEGTVSARCVAEHLALAGRDLEAGEWFRLAAAAAADQEEAAEDLRAAIALGRDTAAVREELGGVLVRLGQYDEALVAYQHAETLVAQSSAPPETEARLEQAIADVHDRLGETVLAHAGLERAAALATGVARSKALAALALVQHRRNLPEARGTAREALALAGDDAGARARAHHTMGILALAREDVATATEELAAAEKLSRTAEDTDTLIAVLTGQSRLAMLRGDGRSALEAAREGLSLAERVGDVHRLGALHSHIADTLHSEGRDEEAQASQRASAAALARVTGASDHPEVWTLAPW